MKKKLPIGISDFKKLIEDNYFYVDKSLFIKELLASGAAATLIPRPRRFGKTLNLSMLRYFFEKTEESNRNLFNDLKISKEKDIMSHQGQYPVIYLTFKDIKESNWNNCYGKIKELLSNEFERHYYLIEGDFLTVKEKSNFQNIINYKAEQFSYENALKNLSAYLKKYYKKSPIILIDEYDAPIHAGFFEKYYDNVINFMRGFLCGGLKDNSNLEFAVMTGILRVAKESIFSGINNLEVCTVLGSSYFDKFGLTEDEVDQAIKYYGYDNSINDIRSWYNGYMTGKEITVYNPWSIINFLKNNGILQSYWINTSDNKLVKELIQHSGGELKEKIELLIERKPIREHITQAVVFSGLSSMTSSVWSLLLFTGYLTFKNFALENKRWYADLVIPNDEVEEFYRSTILSWFEQSFGTKKFTNMLKSLVSGDIQSFKEMFHDFILKSFSFFDVSGDEPERFYHALVLGMLVTLSDEYEIKSNRESGYGRYDVMIIPKNKKKMGIIIEFKKVKKITKETIEQAAASALQQIEEKKYSQELHSRGIKNILKVGIAFDGKKSLVVEKI